jgi:hypothetical protein
VKQIRKRLTYSNVMSSIAVFLVLGGATAFAAGLAKNSVGSKQIKKNAVTSAKIKNNAVTTPKIKNGAISGAKINLGSLGTVPSATNATNAANAANAAKVNGQTPVKVFRTLLPGQSTEVANIAGFSIAALCESGNIDVSLSSPGGSAAVLSAQGNGESEGPYFEYEANESGSSSSIPLDGEPDNTYGQVSFSGALGNGTVISGELGYDYDTFGGESPERCVVYGEVTTG